MNIIVYCTAGLAMLIARAPPRNKAEDANGATQAECETLTQSCNHRVTGGGKSSGTGSGSGNKRVVMDTESSWIPDDGTTCIVNESAI